MAKHYLLLAAIPALMMAACSDDNVIDNGGANNPPAVNNSLNLKSLSASSQSGRIKKAQLTRGTKADRLQLVAQIAPMSLSDAHIYNWSATSVAVANGKAYVTWHSNRQAANQATVWGGALDFINIPTDGSYDFNIDGTMVTDRANTDQNDKSQVVKFNNIIADGTDLYIAGTSDKYGAVISRVSTQADVTTGIYPNTTISIPGSSANSMAVVDGTDLVAVSGYTGGAYRLPKAFAEDSEITTITAQTRNYGGKYIADGYILRTDAANSYLYNIAAGTQVELDAPLVSEEKYAESFDDATGTWKPTDGQTAAYYGKHTMCTLGDYIYVAAGINGLRVYDANGGKALWSNGINVTAVTAFNTKDKDGNSHALIAAATGNGLRIYRPYDDSRNEGDEMLLYAYEVDKYNNDGHAAESATAGKNGHSANFIAVDETNGFIFVAYGQTGVNVYKLDAELWNEVKDENLRKLIIPAIDSEQSKNVKEDNESAEFLVPADVPEVPEGKEFVGWSENPNDPESPVYKPGDKVTVTPEKPNVTLEPVFRDKGTKDEYTVSFDVNGGEGTYPDQKVIDGESPVLPENNPTKEGYDFLGWSADGKNPIGDDYKVTGNVTLVALWKEKAPKYTIVFDANGKDATNMPAQIATNDNPIKLLSEAPKANSYDFKGWSTDPDKSPLSESLLQPGADFTPSEGKNTLYAIWADHVQGGTGDNPPVGGDDDDKGNQGGGQQNPDEGGAE